MRHSRSEEFARALNDDGFSTTRRWADLTSDPNDPAALIRRAQMLRTAWRPSIPDRAEFIVRRCASRRVLDIGCVAHEAARMGSPQWLHARLASVAERCVGVDVLADGVQAMRDRGFEAYVHDLTDGLGPLEAEAPFDVIVAGELIEHVEALGMLFATAKAALASDGELIVTTPNPYAPHRVRAGQLGIVWENADHVLYAFPSGIVELAERHGLTLAEAADSDDRQQVGVAERLRAARRRLRGRHHVTVGFATVGKPSVRRVKHVLFREAVQRLLWRRRRFLGETFVYVIRHGADRA